MGLKRSLKKAVKSVVKVTKKVAPVAAVAAGAYFAGPALLTGLKTVGGAVVSRIAGGGGGGSGAAVPEVPVQVQQVYQPPMNPVAASYPVNTGSDVNRVYGGEVMTRAAGVGAVAVAPTSCAASGGDPLTFAVVFGVALLLAGYGWWRKSRV